MSGINQKIRILGLIGYTEPSSFGEFCNALGSDKPSEKSEWAELFGDLRYLENNDLIEVERDNSGKISSLQVTDEGKATIEQHR